MSGDGGQTSNLIDDVLRRLDAEEKLPAAVSELVLASLYGEGQIEECLGGQAPGRPDSSADEAVQPVRAYIDTVEVEGFRGIGAKELK